MQDIMRQVHVYVWAAPSKYRNFLYALTNAVLPEERYYEVIIFLLSLDLMESDIVVELSKTKWRALPKYLRIINIPFPWTVDEIGDDMDSCVTSKRMRLLRIRIRRIFHITQ